MDLSNENAKDTFVDIFKNLHENGSLMELYLNGTGIKNIYEKLINVPPVWGNSKLLCDR